MNNIDISYQGMNDAQSVERHKLINSISPNRFHCKGSYLFEDKDTNKNTFTDFCNELILKFDDKLNYTMEEYDISFYKEEEIYLTFRYSEKLLKLEAYGKSKDYVDNLVKQVCENLVDQKYTSNLYADWCFYEDGDMNWATFPIKNQSNMIPELYPHVPDVKKYFEDFKASKENVLVILGEPGLGKTSFIREMMIHNEWNARLTYDEKIMTLDDFYISFIQSDDRDVLILEDSDLLLEERLEFNNKIMTKILNASEGLINIRKKFIFTANITSSKNIDQALTRPGRCFDILEFRPLTIPEAENISNKLKISLPETKKKEYTLAEIFNQSKSTRHKTKVGF